MRTYTRARIPGATYFFTVNLEQRSGNDLLIRRIDDLRCAFKETQRDHPFDIEAIVVLPDHLHCLWRLPPEDANFSNRWRLIKARFSRRLAAGEHVSASRKRKGERGIWQRRYWEHVICDDRDYAAHVDYIHFNPVKHGYVDDPAKWPHSSFARYVTQGLYPKNWAAQDEIMQMDRE